MKCESMKLTLGEPYNMLKDRNGERCAPDKRVEERRHLQTERSLPPLCPFDLFAPGLTNRPPRSDDEARISFAPSLKVVLHLHDISAPTPYPSGGGNEVHRLPEQDSGIRLVIMYRRGVFNVPRLTEFCSGKDLARAVWRRRVAQVEGGRVRKVRWRIGIFPAECHGPFVNMGHHLGQGRFGVEFGVNRRIKLNIRVAVHEGTCKPIRVWRGIGYFLVARI